MKVLIYIVKTLAEPTIVVLIGMIMYRYFSYEAMFCTMVFVIWHFIDELAEIKNELKHRSGNETCKNEA